MSVAYDNFIARVTGASAGLKDAYKNLLDGLTTDGLFNSDGTSSVFDALYVFATQDSTTALLNLVSSSFTATNANSLTFTTNVGYTSDTNVLHYIDSGFNPTTASSPKFVQNSSHLAGWSGTSGALDNEAIMYGGGGGSSNCSLYPRFQDGNFYFRIGNVAGGNAANSDGKGHYVGNRTNSSTVQGWKNGVQQGSDTASTSLAPSNLNFAFAAGGDGGLIVQSGSFGSTLTGTQILNYYTRLNTFMTAAAAGFPAPAATDFGDQRRRSPWGAWSPKRGPLTGRGYTEPRYDGGGPLTDQAPAMQEQQRTRLPQKWGPRTPLTAKSYIEPRYDGGTPLTDQAPAMREQQRARRPGGWSPKRGPLSGKSFVELPVASVANAYLTQADAALSAASTLAIAATASLTQADASLSAAATLAISATASLTQADATLSAAATLAIAATASLTQADAAFSGTGETAPFEERSRRPGSWGPRQGPLRGRSYIEVPAPPAAVIPPINASATLTQDDATLTAASVLTVGASASLTQADATLVAAATLPIAGNAGLTQADGVLTATAVAAIAVSAAIVEAGQTLSASAFTVNINASATLTQDDFALSSQALGGGVSSLGGKPERWRSDMGRYWRYRPLKKKQDIKAELEALEKEIEEEISEEIIPQEPEEVLRDPEEDRFDELTERSHRLIEAIEAATQKAKAKSAKRALQAMQARAIEARRKIAEEEEEQAAWLLLHLL